MTESIDVKKIMEKIRNQIMNNPTIEPINQNNIISIASQKFKERRQKIMSLENENSTHLEFLDSKISKPLVTEKENLESFEKELTEANLSYDIQTFEKVDTTKPKIIRNLVLKIRNMLQDEVRFALNPIVEKQIKFNIHSVRSLTGLKKLIDKIELKHQLRMDEIDCEQHLRADKIELTHLLRMDEIDREQHLRVDKIELKHQLRMDEIDREQHLRVDKIELKHQITSDLVESQHHAMEDLKKEILILKIFRAYNQYLKRDPSDQDIKYMNNMIDSGSISRDALADAIKESDEAVKQERYYLKSVGISTIDDKLLLKTVDGHKIYFDKTEKSYLEPFSHDEFYQPEVDAAIKKLLKPGMNVINIGANIGYFTLLAARQVGPQGRVFAFEPFPRSVKLLQKNIEVNGYKNVQVIPVAVSNKIGTSTLSLADDSLQHILSSKVQEDRKKIEVPLTSVDEFLKDKGEKIDFMIIDAEGSESKIFDGMKKTLHQNPTIEIITEYNPEFLQIAGSGGKEFLDKIEDLGFLIHIINQDNLKSQKAIKEEILKVAKGKSVDLYLTKKT